MRQDASQEGRTGPVLGAMCFAVVVVVASVALLNVALVKIASDLDASAGELTWIADAYTVSLAGLVLPFGALGDRVGRRNLLLAGTAIFGLAAAVATFADSPELLIGLRVVMGVGAAMVMPGTLSTITATFPSERREYGVAVWTGFAGAGAILGMVGAGLLMHAFSWRSIFVATAIAAALSFALSVLGAPETRDPRTPRVDRVGAGLAVLAITGLTLALIGGPDRGWTDPLTLASALTAAVTGVAYALWSLQQVAPLLDPRLFRRPAFTAGAIALTAQNLMMLGMFLVILQNMQLVLGFSPLRSALGLLPVALMILPASALTPILVHRLGLRVTMVIGMVLLVVSQVWLALVDIADGYLTLVLATVPMAIGFALAATPATTSIVSSLPSSAQGLASAVNDVTREVGQALGIALLGSLFTSTVEHRLPSGLAAAAGGAGQTAVDEAIHAGSVRAFAAAALVLAIATVAVAFLGRSTVTPDAIPPSPEPASARA